MELSIGRELLVMGTFVLAIVTVLWLLARSRGTTR